MGSRWSGGGGRDQLEVMTVMGAMGLPGHPFGRHKQPPPIHKVHYWWRKLTQDSLANGEVWEPRKEAQIDGVDGDLMEE